MYSLKLCKSQSNMRSKFSSSCGYLESATVGMPRVCNRRKKQQKAIAKLQGKTRSLPWSGSEQCSIDVTNDAIAFEWWAFWVYQHKELIHTHNLNTIHSEVFFHRSCMERTENFTCEAPWEQHNSNSIEGPLIFAKGHAAFTFHKAVHLLNLLSSNSPIFQFRILFSSTKIETDLNHWTS